MKPLAQGGLCEVGFSGPAGCAARARTGGGGSTTCTYALCSTPRFGREGLEGLVERIWRVCRVW